MAKRAGITPENFDDIFISERDGEPFVIRYGLKGVADVAAVFEATGVEGKRLIALRSPIEVDEAEYDDYLSGKIKPERAQALGAGEAPE